MIIGLCGYAGSGKDTAFKLMEWERPECKRFSFADALKKEVAEGLGRSVAWVEENKGCPHVRQLLQAWGMTRREFEGNDYWITRLERNLYHHQTVSSPARPLLPVITDVRLSNEIDYIRKVGGVIVRINRDGVGPINNHVSEHE